MYMLTIFQRYIVDTKGTLLIWKNTILTAISRVKKNTAVIKDQCSDSWRLVY